MICRSAQPEQLGFSSKVVIVADKKKPAQRAGECNKLKQSFKKSREHADSPVGRWNNPTVCDLYYSETPSRITVALAQNTTDIIGN